MSEAKKYKKRSVPPAPPAEYLSERCLVQIPPEKTALFRFLMEAYDNVAMFTVLDRREALLKISYSPHQRIMVGKMLEDMGSILDLSVRAWPKKKSPSTTQV